MACLLAAESFFSLSRIGPFWSAYWEAFMQPTRLLGTGTRRFKKPKIFGCPSPRHLQRKANHALSCILQTPLLRVTPHIKCWPWPGNSCPLWATFPQAEFGLRDCLILPGGTCRSTLKRRWSRKPGCVPCARAPDTSEFPPPDTRSPWLCHHN